MIEFSNKEFIFRLEQNTIKDSECSLKIFDKEYNLIKIKYVSINKLSSFLITEFYN
jgi:hypothetical protein